MANNLIREEDVVAAMAVEAMQTFACSNELVASERRISLRRMADRLGIQFDPHSYRPREVGCCTAHRQHSAPTGRYQPVVEQAVLDAAYQVEPLTQAAPRPLQSGVIGGDILPLPPPDRAVVYQRVTEEVRWEPVERQVPQPVPARPRGSAAVSFSRYAGQLVRVDQGWVFDDGNGLRGELYRWDDWMPVTIQQAQQMGYYVSNDATWVLVTRQ